MERGRFLDGGPTYVGLLVLQLPAKAGFVGPSAGQLGGTGGQTRQCEKWWPNLDLA